MGSSIRRVGAASTVGVLAALLACKQGDGGPGDETSLAPVTSAQAARLEASYAQLRSRLQSAAALLPPPGTAPAPLAAAGLSWLESSPGSPVAVLMAEQLTADGARPPWFAERLVRASSFLDQCLCATGAAPQPYVNGAVLFNRECSAVARNVTAVLALRVVAHEPPRVEGAAVGPGKLVLDAHLLRLPNAGHPAASLGGVRSTHADPKVRLADPAGPGHRVSTNDLVSNFYHHALRTLQQDLRAAGLTIAAR